MKISGGAAMICNIISAAPESLNHRANVTMKPSLLIQAEISFIALFFDLLLQMSAEMLSSTIAGVNCTDGKITAPIILTGLLPGGYQEEAVVPFIVHTAETLLNRRTEDSRAISKATDVSVYATQSAA